MLEFGGTLTVGDFRPRRNGLDLAGSLVEAGERALVIAGVDDVRIGRIGRDIAGFAAAHRIPVRTIDASAVAAAGDGDGSVVLLRAVNTIRNLVVGDDVIELRGGLVVLACPGLAAV